MDFKLSISEEIASALKAVYDAEPLSVSEIAAGLEVPPDAAMGDYAFPCFKLSKGLRKSPMMIADSLKDAIHADYLGKIESVKGYLNFFIDRATYAEKIVSAVLAQDKRVRMVSFTGGGNAGRKIAMAAAQDFKRTAMELGGKNPLLVLRDYDLDEAVKTAGIGAFSNQGQLCMATSRILVEEPLYEAFCEKLRDYALSLKVGDPTDPDVFIGPLIDERHCDFVRSQVDDAVAKGAALLCGGTHEGPFFRPTVLCNVDESMRIFYEESFAPVTSVIPVKDADEALAKCNDNLFGLSAAVLTHDLDRAMELGMKIEAGMVHINDLTYLSSTTAPCGGWKESGVGREGGQFSMDDYTELKWLTFQSNRTW